MLDEFKVVADEVLFNLKLIYDFSLKKLNISNFKK